MAVVPTGDMAADVDSNGATHAEHDEQLCGSTASYACTCSLPLTGVLTVLALLPLKTGVGTLQLVQCYQAVCG